MQEALARTEELARLAAAAVAVAVLAAGCVGAATAPPAATAERPLAVWVVRHDWHTGVVVRRADLPTGRWPEHRDLVAEFSPAYLEVGWGERRFYQAPEGTSGLALRAALGRNESVLHVAGFDAPVDALFPADRALRVPVSAAELATLAEFLAAAYARDTAGAPIPLGPGLYGRSRFYLGREPYALPETCNTWTARALRAAGLPVDADGAWTASGVMRRARAALAERR